MIFGGVKFQAANEAWLGLLKPAMDELWTARFGWTGRDVQVAGVEAAP